MGINFTKVDYFYKHLKTKCLALEDIDLNIEAENEFIAITGQTGSGKTTLVQHMNALLLPSVGKVQIFDIVIDASKRRKPKVSKCRKDVGLVFQFPEYQLFSETIYKDILFGPKNFKELSKKANQLADKAVELVKLDKNLLDKSPFKISGGQQRKVAIAGILAMDPKIIVLDEPTRGLDPIAQDDIMDMFYEIHKTTKKTIILITHDMDVACKYANRIIVLDGSRICYDGKKEDLFLTDKYLQHHLDLPSSLKIVNHLNKKLNLNIKPTFDYNVLVKKLGDIK